MIAIRESAGAVTLAVHVTPGARRNLVGGEHDGALRVAVAQAAEKGKANRAVVDALSKALGVRRGQLEVIAGQTARRKTIRIVDVSETTLRAALAPLQ